MSHNVDTTCHDNYLPDHDVDMVNLSRLWPIISIILRGRFSANLAVKMVAKPDNINISHPHHVEDLSIETLAYMASVGELT